MAEVEGAMDISGMTWEYIQHRATLLLWLVFDLPSYLRPTAEQHRQFADESIPHLKNWTQQWWEKNVRDSGVPERPYDGKAIERAFFSDLRHEVQRLREDFVRKQFLAGGREGLNPVMGPEL